MMYTRYHVAAGLAAGGRVLELGCGAGQGFGLIARNAKTLIGGDYSRELLRSARDHYGDRIPLVQLSADSLPFATASFDLVLFFEASYYVPSMEKGFAEIARVLAPAGRVLFVNANPERPDFISSPHSVHYHSADEFRSALEGHGFSVGVEGAFPVDEDQGERSPIAAMALSVARRILEILHLVPRTLRGRARIKRLLYGNKLVMVPPELQVGFSEVVTREPLSHGAARRHKVLYVNAERPAAATSQR